MCLHGKYWCAACNIGDMTRITKSSVEAKKVLDIRVRGWRRRSEFWRGGKEVMVKRDASVVHLSALRVSSR